MKILCKGFVNSWMDFKGGVINFHFAFSLPALTHNPNLNTTGVLKSKYFPNNYFSNLNCVLLFTNVILIVAKDKNETLKFKNKMVFG